MYLHWPLYLLFFATLYPAAYPAPTSVNLKADSGTYRAAAKNSPTVMTYSKETKKWTELPSTGPRRPNNLAPNHPGKDEADHMLEAQTVMHAIGGKDEWAKLHPNLQRKIHEELNAKENMQFVAKEVNNSKGKVTKNALNKLNFHKTQGDEAPYFLSKVKPLDNYRGTPKPHPDRQRLVAEEHKAVQSDIDAIKSGGTATACHDLRKSDAHRRVQKNGKVIQKIGAKYSPCVAHTKERLNSNGGNKRRDRYIPLAMEHAVHTAVKIDNHLTKEGMGHKANVCKTHVDAMKAAGYTFRSPTPCEDARPAPRPQASGPRASGPTNRQNSEHRPRTPESRPASPGGHRPRGSTPETSPESKRPAKQQRIMHS